MRADGVDDGAEALLQAGFMRPDVFIFDVNLSGIGGLVQRYRDRFNVRTHDDALSFPLKLSGRRGDLCELNERPVSRARARAVHPQSLWCDEFMPAAYLSGVDEAERQAC